MKVFLSWSGPRSGEVALLFRGWLPKVIQAVEPWASPVDIAKGAQWFGEISRELSDSSFGIVFLTRENLAAPWLHFEAGALAKALQGDGGAKVCTYLLGIEHTEVRGPLAEFNGTKATAEDTLKMLQSMNASLTAKGERPLKEDVLKDTFAALWPSIAGDLNKLIVTNAAEARPRSVEDMVAEILEHVRPRAEQQRARTAADQLGELLAMRERVLAFKAQTQLRVEESRYVMAAAEAKIALKGDAEGRAAAAAEVTSARSALAVAEAQLAALEAKLRDVEMGIAAAAK